MRIWALDHDAFVGADNVGQSAGTDRCLLFRHAGHRSSIVDLNWNTLQPWTLGSISDDIAVSARLRVKS